MKVGREEVKKEEEGRKVWKRERPSLGLCFDYFDLLNAAFILKVREREWVCVSVYSIRYVSIKFCVFSRMCVCVCACMCVVFVFIKICDYM